MGKISHVPDRYGFVSWTTQKHKFVKGRKVKGIYLICVCNYLKHWLSLNTVAGWVLEPHIPEHDQTVVWATSKDIRMHFMPGNILHRCIVVKDFIIRNDFVILLSIFTNVPDTNPLICLSWNQQISVVHVPTQAISLACVSNESMKDLAFFRKQNLPCWMTGGDQRWPFIAISCSIYFMT